jgi:eukaryotic-like serine/threonine-protein kinase
MLQGLGAAHAADIIHRDLKPDNIFILKEKAGVHDYVKIIDFGISKFNQLSGDGMKMTRTGAVMGTPYYMSPEQASGSAEADQRSDIYSVGVILYEAITGRVPFDAGTFNQLMFKIVLSEVPPPETIVPDLDPAFSSIIAKAMARDLTQRFQSTEEFIRALDAWAHSGASVSVPPTGDAASAGLLPGSQGRGPLGSQTSIDRNGGPGGTAAGVGTSGNWASSQPDAVTTAVPKKSNGGLIAGLVAVGVLVMGGAAFGAYSVLGKKAEPAAAESASPDRVAAAPAEAAKSEAAAPPLAATPPTPTPAAEGTGSAATSAAPPTPSTDTKAAVAAQRPAAPAKAAAAKPGGAAPAKPPSKAAAPKPGGAPDFGY